MKKLVIDGNAVYEIDEQCMKRKQEKEEWEKEKKRKKAIKETKES